MLAIVVLLQIFALSSSIDPDKIKAKHTVLVSAKGGPDAKWVEEHTDAMVALTLRRAKFHRGSTDKNQTDHKAIRAAIGPKNNMTSDSLAEAHPDLEDVALEGDMVFNNEQLAMLTDPEGAGENRTKREATTDPTVLWTVGTPIPFEIDSSLSNIAYKIRAGIKFWSDNTCLKFQESSTAVGRLHYYSGSGCWSYVGKQKNWPKQDVSIGSGCDSMGTICHETAHAMGFMHTQSRFDRDNNINVYYSNIQPSLQYNFAKMTAQTETHFGMDYDYGSVMQYNPYAFAVDYNYVTSAAKDPNYQNMMGQRIQPSFADVKQMNLLYKCASLCSSQPVCQNNGITNPNQCSSCICPRYFEGTLCSSLKKGNAPVCNGQVLTADTTTKTFTSSVGLGMTYKMSDTASDCYWQINAPVGYAINLWITKLDTTCMENCPWAGFEINYGHMDLSGMLVCCSAIYSSPYSSVNNTILIKGTSSYNNANMSFSYKAVKK